MRSSEVKTMRPAIEKIAHIDIPDAALKHDNVKQVTDFLISRTELDDLDRVIGTQNTKNLSFTVGLVTLIGTLITKVMFILLFYLITMVCSLLKMKPLSNTIKATSFA